jgi:hypothetical protein
MVARTMERRILGWALGLAHLVIAGVVIGVLGAVLLYVLDLGGALLFGISPADHWQALLAAPWVAGLVLLVTWDLTLSFWAGRTATVANELAMDGRYAEASERLRALHDREPLLRLAGVRGWVFRRARIVEAYACFLQGMGREAFDLALESSGRTPMGRVAAGIAAFAAAEQGDAASLARVPASAREAAVARPDRASSAVLLSAFAHLELQSLRLKEAERWISLLPAGSRSSLTQRASLAAMTGDLDSAERLLQEVRSAPRAPGSRLPAALFQVQLTDVALAEIAWMRGDAALAASRMAEIAKAGPRHRYARVALALFPALAGGADAARTGLEQLASLAQQWSFDPVMGWRTALASARLRRAIGDPAGALAALRPALAAPPAVRQEALFEQGAASAEAGDATGARVAFEEAARLAPSTRTGRLASDRLATVTSVTSPA